MAEPPRYWTPEWIKGFEVALRADAGFKEAARSFSDTIQLRVVNTPDGKDAVATYVIDRGEVSITLEERPAPWVEMRSEPFDKNRCMARTTAPYELWCKLDRGEMNVLQAITSPEYRLEGSKLRVMRHIAVFSAMSVAASKFPKTY